MAALLLAGANLSDNFLLGSKVPSSSWSNPFALNSDWTTLVSTARPCATLEISIMVDMLCDPTVNHIEPCP